MLSAMTLTSSGPRCVAINAVNDQSDTTLQIRTTRPGLFEACRAGAEGWEKAAASLEDAAAELSSSAFAIQSALMALRQTKDIDGNPSTPRASADEQCRPSKFYGLEKLIPA